MKKFESFTHFFLVLADIQKCVYFEIRRFDFLGRKFGFDHILDPMQRQSDVWDATEPLVQSAIDGCNVCIFAYGQTGSGKTFTMVGDSSGPNQGLIYRSVEKLFEAKRRLEANANELHCDVEISVELLEIYNENVRDLLASPVKKGDIGREINLRLSSNEAIGNILVAARSKDDVTGILRLAQARRCVKSTHSNSESSRSHMLFTMHFVMKETNVVVRAGKLNICDLAGSERLSKSGSHMAGVS